MAGSASESSLPVSESTGYVCCLSPPGSCCHSVSREDGTEKAGRGSTHQTTGAQREKLCTGGPGWGHQGLTFLLDRSLAFLEARPRLPLGATASTFHLHLFGSPGGQEVGEQPEGSGGGRDVLEEVLRHDARWLLLLPPSFYSSCPPPLFKLEGTKSEISDYSSVVTRLVLSLPLSFAFLQKSSSQELCSL